MDQLVQQITARLYRRLNEEQSYYTPADLSEAGLPDFLIARIRLELERNLRESIVPPESDWASMSAADVQQAWGLFLDAINGQVRLPKSFARGVVESAVADLVDLLSEPRAHFPGYLFGSDETLSEEQLSSRMRLMVVYPHLGLFAPRYLKKRGLSQLSRSQYSRLLTQIDERVCKNYSPLNWVQLLEPLFTLCGGEVEAELLARFFREKGLTDQARRLQLLPDPVDAQQLVELLSKPFFRSESESEEPFLSAPAQFHEESPTLDKSGTTEQPENPADALQPATRVVPGSIAAAAYRKLRNSAQETGSNQGSLKITPTSDKPGQTDSDDKPLVSSLERPDPETLDSQNISISEAITPETNDSEAEDASTGEVPLYRQFAQEDEDTDEVSAPEYESGSEPGPEEEEESEAFEDEAHIHELPRFGNYGAPEEPDVEPETGDADEEEDAEADFIPLWQRLRIDNDTDEDYEKNQHDADPDDGDAALQPAPDSARFEALYGFLKEDEPRFLRDIFESDRRAYIGALERISGFDNWREAGKYLTNEIFRRYNVDMYKDVSIDFTDQLHRFFKNYA